MKLSEGVRRICLVIGTLLAASVIIYFVDEGAMFTDLRTFLVIFGIVIPAFFLPFFIFHIFHWVRAGFEKDNLTSKK